MASSVTRIAAAALCMAAGLSLPAFAAPGTVQFKQVSTVVIGSFGGFFLVSRTGGATGAISVNYVLENGTALAGTDYAAAAGTLHWADGDTADKTIHVTASVNTAGEGTEYFKARLSNPVGTTLGDPATSIGIIPEMLYAIPAGFTTGGPNAWDTRIPFTPITGREENGIRSAHAFGSVAQPGISDLTYTGNFQAGYIVFTYLVSSYQDRGIFQLLVDGVVVFSETGETGWQTFAYNLPAGAHTLTWRFINSMPSACNGAWTPPAEGGANCADRVWIDALALPPPNPARLANISTRGQVLTGNDVMIAGFIIGGLVPKTVVTTVAGPSLIPAGIPNALANPTLTLVRSSDGAVVATNDNWQTQTNPAHVSAIQTAGFAPAHALEPAIIATLPPGAYTAIVQGVGGTGVGLVGLYEVTEPTAPLVNISTRGQVMTGNDVMIAGFIIHGAPKSVVVTVAGPSLNGVVPNALADPTLVIVRSSDGAVVATNDNWQAQANPAHVSAITSAGFAPSHFREPAVILTLAPGAYTAIVQGVGSTGVGLVGVYAIP